MPHNKINDSELLAHYKTALEQRETIPQFGKRIGVSETTAHRYIKRLREMGAYTKTLPRGPQGKTKRILAVYQFAVENNLDRNYIVEKTGVTIETIDCLVVRYRLPSLKKRPQSKYKKIDDKAFILNWGKIRQVNGTLQDLSKLTGLSIQAIKGKRRRLRENGTALPNLKPASKNQNTPNQSISAKSKTKTEDKEN